MRNTDCTPHLRTQNLQAAHVCIKFLEALLGEVPSRGKHKQDLRAVSQWLTTLVVLSAVPLWVGEP